MWELDGEGGLIGISSRASKLLEKALGKDFNRDSKHYSSWKKVQCLGCLSTENIA